MKQKRKLTWKQKEAMQEQKDSLCEEQGGRCYYCKLDFNRDGIYPHAAHVLIPSSTNILKYGWYILDHRLNFKITCSDCNSKAIISNPESQTGKYHIEAIRQDILNKVHNRR